MGSMGAGETSTVALKRCSTPTPKAIIYQKYGSKASYEMEEIQQSVQNECPGLAIPQRGPCLFRCTLQLPEFSVTSGTFTRKKEAEQAAAKIALEKLGIQPTTNNPTEQDAWSELISRISFLFSNEFLLSTHPLSGHFKAAFRREGDFHGLLPVSILASCDAKLNNLSKSINQMVESNPSLIIPLIMRAARSSDLTETSDGKLWIWRRIPYSLETIQALVDQQSSSTEGLWIEAIQIPFSIEKPVQPVTLNIPCNGYYMDVIAQKLGVADASQVLVSRTVGKASSEMRLYYSALFLPHLLDSSSEDPSNAKAIIHDPPYNARGSYISGQSIYGDAILAAVGYTWKSESLFNEDVSLSTYYRMLIGKLPNGAYKLSREAILAAELPVAFTTRSNWRGSYPRDLLCMFCRQHWLSEPVFSTLTINCHVDSSSASSARMDNSNVGEVVGQGSTFRCEIKILSKGQDLIIECSPKASYRKQNDAIQSTALKVLSWLNDCFEQREMCVEKLYSSGDIFGICVYPENFSKEFALSLSVHTRQQTSALSRCSFLGSNCIDLQRVKHEHKVFPLNIEGPDSGVSPSNGSLVCMRYIVSLVREEEHMKEPLESCDEFEFEIGTGAVIPQLEACLTQMSVNQSAHFTMELPSRDLLLAAAGNFAKSLSLLSLQACFLEYSLTLLEIAEPLEDRMEQAQFSPPLSKQRVEFAVRHINKSCASTLVDFGCGSGSLLDSLLDHPTALEKIVGVDISLKSLSRAAKVLHSKLSANSDPISPNKSIKSAVLYDGSITLFDSRLYGFDIGTCLEVIEHMEEDQACLFGDVVLSSFCPQILIVSTPNYEYNPILQRNSQPNQEEDPDEKNQSLPCKFRNHDHKFEWTREQFNCWASNLAMRHNYSVEFSGVGGPADTEPGFASQIAVFRRRDVLQADKCLENRDLSLPYEVIWEWSSSNRSGSAL